MTVTETALADRTVLATDGDLALAELKPGESELVDELGDHSFKPDPDTRPAPLQVTRYRAALLDARTGDLLGRMSWWAVPYGVRLGGITWNLGMHLLPVARGRGNCARAGLLLARYLFDTTEVDRVQATNDVSNVAGWRAAESAGFHREGVLRGAYIRGGTRRDMVISSLLRSDLEPAGARTVLRRRDGVLLARIRPDDRTPVRMAANDAFAPDPDRTPTPSTSPGHLASVLDANTERVIGIVQWHTVDNGGTGGCAAWDIRALLTPDGRAVVPTVWRMVAEHLFATTDLDRVQAVTDAEDLATHEALAKAGFRQEGHLRGARLRGGVRRDATVHGLLRTDLPIS
jgi:RimJ/RimL family protein N-acetyltransferase